MAVKIVFLAEELRVGGAETYFYNLANAAKENEIDFYSMAVDRGKYDVANDLRLRLSEYGFNPIDRVIKITREIKAINPDVMHANSLQLLICAAIAKRLAKSDCKIVYTKHNLTKLETVCRGLYYRVVNCISDAIVVVCASDRLDFEDAGVNPEIIVQINNGVNVSNFDYVARVPNHERPVLGILARLSPEKNHGLFLEVCAELKALGVSVIGKIGGDGTEFSSIAEKIDRLGLADNVELCGRVNAASFLNELDYLLIVSNREVLPMSILEAMASGCLVIARNVGGVSDAVSRECGLILNRDAPAADYAAMIDRMTNEEYAQITKNARNRVVSEFNLAESLNRHYALYKALSGQ